MSGPPVFDVDVLSFEAPLEPGEMTRRIRMLMDAAFDDFTDDDWDHMLGGTHVWAVSIGLGGRVLGHAAVVPRTLWIGGRAWRCGFVEGVAVRPSHQRRGLGARVMAEINRVIAERYELGALSTGVHSFYEGLGWEAWQGPSSARSADGVDVPTPDDDGGILVLRVGPSTSLDLTLPISCEARPGDDW